MKRCASILLVPLLCVISRAYAVDDDKAGLFNTFYLEGDQGPYVLVMRENKTFDLYGPGGAHLNGTVRASAEHVTLTSGEVKRFFHFDLGGSTLKLGRRDTDKLTKGNLLGTLPPTTDTREVWATETLWRKRGHKPMEFPASGVPVGPPPVAVNPPPDGPATRPVAPAAIPAGAQDFNDIVGSYAVTSEGLTDSLTIAADGTFDYTPPGGTRQRGTLLRADNELSFVSAQHTRHLSMRRTADGLELSRRDTDVLKAGDPIGTMPPTERKPLVWKRQRGSPAPAPVAVPEAAPAPVAAPPVVVAPPPAAPKAAGVAVRDLKTITGTYVHKANPFISETLIFADDGSFTYKDSNGATASGNAKIDNDVLVLTAGEVVRRFKASTEDRALVLHCDGEDKPAFKNDLASMSPTVLKVAKYEKK
jgi:hypothetical protein